MNAPLVIDPQPLAARAVRVGALDNVAVAKVGLRAGERLVLDGSRVVELTGVVEPGHRFALEAIPAGRHVLQYGAPIGTSRGIGVGDPIGLENMSNEVPTVREVPEGLNNPAPEYLAPGEVPTFEGFLRPDGRTGIRNWVLIVPTSMCASHEAQQIAMRAEFTIWSRERFPNVDGIVALPHNKGCGCNDGENIEVMLRTLRNYADHPNVGAVLFMELGCEKTNLTTVSRYLKRTGGLSTDKPIRWLGIQGQGGTLSTIDRGLEIVGELLEVCNRTPRQQRPMSELVLGVKCGGSDGFSGLSANPALGHAADLLVKAGGTVLITEVPEFCGAEHLFASRARDAGVAREIYATVDWYKAYAGKFGSRLDENPSPGNIKGGLLNIAIKSLGAMAKSGTTRVEGCTGYAEPPRGRGLHLMQGPGYDQESTPGLVAAGAQVVVFTTGRGTTIGNAIAPVIKLASNNDVFRRLRGDIDLSAGGVIEGTESIPEVGERVFEHVRQVASGLRAKAEETGHREFQFWAGEAISL